MGGRWWGDNKQSETRGRKGREQSRNLKGSGEGGKSGRGGSKGRRREVESL